MVNQTVTALVGGAIDTPVATDPGAPLEVLGRALTGSDVVGRVVLDLPDVLVIDTRIDDPDVRAVCRRIRDWAPATRVIAVAQADDEAAYTTVVAGASACILASEDPAALADAAMAVARGESVLLPRMALRLVNDVDAWAQRSGDPLYPSPTLTATEREVLVGLGGGQSPAEIAATHSVTPHLVNLHAGFAVAKLHRYVLGAERIAAGDGT